MNDFILPGSFCRNWMAASKSLGGMRLAMSSNRMIDLLCVII